MSRNRLTILAQYLRPYKTQALLGTLALLVVNGLGVYIPLQIRQAIEELQVSFSYDRILVFAGSIFALASVMWLIRVASRVYLFGLGRRVEFDLKQRIFQHLLTLESGYFASNTSGDLINRATSDVDSIRRMLGFAVLSLLNTTFAYALTVPVLVSISWKLTLLAMSVYPFMLAVVWFFSGRLRLDQASVQESLSRISDLIQEDMSGIAPIKIYGQEANERSAFAQTNADLLASNLALARTRTTLFPLLQGLAAASLLILMAFGSGEIVSGALDVGGLVAMIIYIDRLVFPTALLGFTLTVFQRGQVSIDRVEAIFERKAKIFDHVDAIDLPLDRVEGHIRAHQLTYAFPTVSQQDSENSSTERVEHVEAIQPTEEAQAVERSDIREAPIRYALDHLSLDIQAGETIAIVGPIGSGKSTLASAIPHVLKLEPDQLFLDGIDITRIRLNDLRRAIAYVPQDSFLFGTSISNNIRYGDPEASFDDIRRAAQAAQIHDEILNFPQQYDTIVGERGITLSGGQRQRTALARALLLDAPILILDDALSSVDNQTATQILRNLSSGTRKKTVLFISHQLSAAATADRVVVLDRGRAVQVGKHEALLAEGGLYGSLWNEHQLEALLV
jgi:ATP-binding cassette subfamily B multidrug efflux pump